MHPNQQTLQMYTTAFAALGMLCKTRAVPGGGFAG